MKRWTQRQTAQLLRDYAQDFKLSSIALAYGTTVGAVNSKLYRLRKQNPKLKLLWREVNW